MVARGNDIEGRTRDTARIAGHGRIEAKLGIREARVDVSREHDLVAVARELAANDGVVDLDGLPDRVERDVMGRHLVGRALREEDLVVALLGVEDADRIDEPEGCLSPGRADRHVGAVDLDGLARGPADELVAGATDVALALEFEGLVGAVRAIGHRRDAGKVAKVVSEGGDTIGVPVEPENQ